MVADLYREGGGATDDQACPSDAALFAAAQRGDLTAFNQLVERHERVVYGVCLRLLRDPALAEDVAQETFLRAWTARAQYAGGSVRAWLLRIAMNRSYDWLRRSRRRPADSLDAEPVETEPHWSTEPGVEHPVDAALRSELRDRLEAALAALSPEHRLVVLLADVYGYPYEEIATIAEVELGTVKSRLYRARARLRDLLRADPAARELFVAARRLPDGDEGRAPDARPQER